MSSKDYFQSWLPEAVIEVKTEDEARKLENFLSYHGCHWNGGKRYSEYPIGIDRCVRIEHREKDETCVLFTGSTMGYRYEMYPEIDIVNFKCSVDDFISRYKDLKFDYSLILDLI